MVHPVRRRRYVFFGGRRKDVSTTSLPIGCSFPSCQMNCHCCTTMPTMKKAATTTTSDAFATSLMDDSSSISSTQSQYNYYSTPSRRSVTFSPNLEDSIPTLHINDYTLYERKQSCYGSMEYNQMKGSIKDVLSRMVMPPDDDDDSSSSSFLMDVTVDVHLHDHDNQDNCSCCCIRGLEDHIIPSMAGDGRRHVQQQQSRQIRSRLITAILREQANNSDRCQNNNKGNNTDALALLSKTISLPSRQLARQRALFDEQDAAAVAATM